MFQTDLKSDSNLVLSVLALRLPFSDEQFIEAACSASLPITL